MNNDLKQIFVASKTGKEVLTDNEMITKYGLLDFWRWSLSDILSNATRGRFAEFIVGTAIDLNIDKPREEWEPFDLVLDDKIKIEVKSAAYIQSWTQLRLSPIRFSIKPSRFINVETRIVSEYKRHADVYVFCHLTHTDKTSIDPLKLQQWDFYVVPTSQLDNSRPGLSSISLASLQLMTNAIPYCKLKDEIIKAYLQRY
jgi:hypothetical protein